MKFRSLFGALGIAAMVASGAVAAGAQPAPNYNYREASLANVGRFAQACGRLITRLQQDGRDYGGHKEAAMNDLHNAQGELVAAAQWAEAHGYQMPVPRPHAANPYRMHNPQPQVEWSIQKAQMQVQRMISRLQRDSRDFGGHRAAAIDALQRANGELGAAMQFAGGRGY
jgi:hypothetical protein